MTIRGTITEDVRMAADVLQDGGIIGLPTETVYGLAAIAENESSVMRVFATKGRPTNHPLIVHLGTDIDIDEWGVFSKEAKALAKAFWPGPLTLLVRRTRRVPDWVTGGRDTVAIRVPSHPVAQQLLNMVRTGVVAPSANKFGKVSPTTAQHVIDDLGVEVDVVLDGGPCEVGLESTIVECVDDAITILRPGAISADDVESVVAEVSVDASGVSRAPGMLASHYSPSAEVRLFETIDLARKEIEALEKTGLRSSLLHFDNLNAYAEHLYSSLRLADNTGVDVVCAVLPISAGLGAAIRDRLIKAAHR